jgi:hypothetical protein
MERYREMETEDFESYDSMHGTDHYIMKWDRYFTEPSDVYANKGDEWLMYEYPLGEEDLGEDYPRGV